MSRTEGLGVEEVEAFLAGIGDADGIAVGFEAFAERIGEFRFVLHDEDVHESLYRSERPRSASRGIVMIS